MNKLELIGKIIAKCGVDNKTITRADLKRVYGIGNNDLSSNYNQKTVNKDELIKKILEKDTDDISYFGFKGLHDIIDNLPDISRRDCECKCGHENGTSTYCPNCGWKLSDYKKEPELCSNKWCECNEPTLIRNIHIEDKNIRFTHFNDLDTLITMNHSETQEFSGGRGIDTLFFQKLKCMNLAYEITVYPLFPYNSSTRYCNDYKKTIPSEIIQSLGCFINALGKLGYRIQYDDYDGYGDLHIIEMKKENKC